MGEQLVLDERDVVALTALTAAEPVPGGPVLTDDVLLWVSRLIGCDSVGVGLADNTGFLVDARALPHEPLDSIDRQCCDGPLTLGLVHVSRDTKHDLAADGLTDLMWLGFRCGGDHVAQLFLAREHSLFSERDKTMLRMIAPTLRRLMCERPTPALPASLTLAERRVLSQVAAGKSNGEIAERLFVAESTVRKHLEHAYRKLGVRNRLAAAVALRGELLPPSDAREKLAAMD